MSVDFPQAWQNIVMMAPQKKVNFIGVDNFPGDKLELKFLPIYIPNSYGDLLIIDLRPIRQHF